MHGLALAPGPLLLTIVFKTLLVAGFVTASIWLLIHSRDVLLTGVYKFPFPYTFAWLQLLVTLVLGYAVSLGLRCIRLENNRFTEPDPHYLPLHDGSGSSSKRSLGLSEEDNVLQLSCDDIFIEEKSAHSAVLGQHGTVVERFAQRQNTAIRLICLSSALTARVGLANLLLSRTPLSNYLFFYALIAPRNILRCANEPAGQVMQAAAAWITFALAAVPLLQPTGLVSCIVGVLVIALDSIMVDLLRASFVAAETTKITAWDLTDSKATFMQRLQAAMETVEGVLQVLKHAVLGSVFILPIVIILSREFSIIRQDCYILDVPALWSRGVGASALLSLALLCYGTLTVVFASSVASALQTLVCTICLIVFFHSKFAPATWLHIVASIIMSVVVFIFAQTHAAAPQGTSSRYIYRKAGLAVVLYGVLYLGTFLPAANMLPASGTPTIASNMTEAAYALPQDHGEVAYNGRRPSVNAYADFAALIDNCDEGAATGVEGVVKCLNYLAGDSSLYLKESKKNYKPVKNGQESCAGPLRIYHTYWTGPATWRFELFVKAYLHTQNLACSKLWIWLDTDIDAQAIPHMLREDRVFDRMRVLVDQGYVELQAWSSPSHIPLPADSFGLLRNETLPRGLWRDKSDQIWLRPDDFYLSVSTPTQVSDFVRFYALHLFGGVYLDMDILLLRDLRPLLLLPDPEATTQPSWAEQWVEKCQPGDYNSAVLSLPPNSTLTSHLLFGALRMGMNFHPRVLGHMLYREDRLKELPMLQNAFFDPLVTNLRREDSGLCTVPCHKNFESAFLEHVHEPEREWIGLNATASESRNVIKETSLGTNRSMDHFFRGAFAYHIHNQWWKFPQRNSWMDVITRDHDSFFALNRTNTYGEAWAGPSLTPYDRSNWGWLSNKRRHPR